MTDVIQKLEPIFAEVNRQIETQLTSDVGLVNDVCRHILLSGGKRIRPTLFVLASHLCGYRSGREFEFATAFEYLHAASLLHDDVVDGADTRRGRPAAHMVYGNQGVILVGDFLFAKSLAIGTRTGLLAFTDIMSQAVARMAEGEVLQLLRAGDAGIAVTDYEQVIYRKTGALIESSCRLGAVIADAPQEWAEALAEYGRQIGLAFQIVDDVLDYRTTAAEFGKPVGHDLDEGKITLPVILTLARADEDHRAELLRLIAKTERTPEEFARVLTLIDRHQGLELAADRAAQAVARGRGALEALPDRPERDRLRDLAEYILTRRK